MTNIKLPKQNCFLTSLLALGTWLVIISPIASGQVVFKCVDESGTIIFSQSACATDAEEVYLEDSSSDILSERQQYSRNNISRDDQAYEYESNVGSNENTAVIRGRGLSDPTRTLDGRDKQQVIAQRNRDREIDKAIRNVRGTGVVAEQLRAELALEKARNRSLSDPERERTLDKAIRNVRGTSAQSAHTRAKLEAAKYGGTIADYPVNSRASEGPTPTIPAHPIPSNRGGVYIPTGPDGSQYIAPGGGICNKEGPNLNCGGIVKPASGVVIEKDGR